MPNLRKLSSVHRAEEQRLHSLLLFQYVLFCKIKSIDTVNYSCFKPCHGTWIQQGTIPLFYKIIKPFLEADLKQHSLDHFRASLI